MSARWLESQTQLQKDLSRSSGEEEMFPWQQTIEKKQRCRGLPSNDGYYGNEAYVGMSMNRKSGDN